MADYTTEKTAQEKQLSLMRIQTGLLLGIFVLVLAAGVLLFTQFAKINNCFEMIETDLEKLDMDALNAAVGAMTEAVDELSAVDMDTLNAAVASLKEAAEALSDVDMKTINDTVGSLRDAAGKLGAVDIKTLNDTVAALKNAANNLSDMDVDSINALVDSLETVAGKMEKASNTLSNIGNIFKR